MKHLTEHSFYGIRPELLSKDFIAGLVVGEGTFYWTKSADNKKILDLHYVCMYVISTY